MENLGKFGLPVVVGVNHFTSDTEAEFAAIRDGMAEQGVEAISCTHWGDGGAGAEALARAVQRKIDAGRGEAGTAVSRRAAARREDPHDRAADLSGRRTFLMPEAVARRLEGFEEAGFGHVPVCIAKTQYSFTADPTVMGAPDGLHPAGA